MKTIQLTKGKVALVDDEDFVLLSKRKWTLGTHGYAYINLAKRPTLMHRIIMKAKPGQIVDHINGDTLDNQRSNLRFASTFQNSQNSRPRKNKAVPLKGVHFCAFTGMYRAQIKINKKKIDLGRHLTPELAHAAYCSAALGLFKEFARFL